MKRCPGCRRDYYDETLLYCLDDGNALLEGPASMEEPATAILHTADAISDAPTCEQIHKTEHTAIHRSEISDIGKSGFEKVLLAVPILVVIISLGLYFGYRYLGSNTKPIESIAVMPFVNESGDPNVEYLSDGMSEILISRLSQLPNLKVTARSSAFRYKGKEADAKTIGKELNVHAVLTGKVVQRGSELSLYVELVDAGTDKVIWSETYNRQLLNFANLQTEIAKDVSQKLKMKLSGADERLLATAYTENTEAYKLYLRGRFFWNKRTPKDVETSIYYFQQSFGADPAFALAYSGLADSYLTLALFEGGPPAHETMPKARDAATKALMLDDTLGEAHATLGIILNLYEYDFAGSEREHKRALELAPNYATAHLRYSLLLTTLGRHEESLVKIRRALEIEPLSVFVNRAYGDRLIDARRYDEAVVQLKKTLDLDANYPLAHSSLAWVYQVQGNYAESVEEVAKMYEVTDRKDYATLARESYLRDGWQGYLRAMTERQPDLRAYTKATHYTALSEKDRAFAELDRAYQNRESNISRLKVDPRLDPLRDDPRFEELLKKVGFP